jgi:C4-dicarboxylate transporter, DctM subunit
MTLLISSLILLLVAGVPIAICLGASTLLYIVIHTDYPLVMLGQSFLFYMHKYSLLSIPFFITAGFIMGETRLIEKLFGFAYELLRWVPGGLGAATMLTAVVFAAFTGSSVAAASTLGAVSYPILQKRDYPPGLATGIITVGGTLGILIPPSWPLILYGIITDTSIAKLFIAGIVPGVVLGLLLIALIVVVSRSKGVSAERAEAPRIIRALWPAVPGLLMPVLVLGGLYGGFFAPTEAGAVACVYALIYGIVVDRRGFVKAVPGILTQSLRITTMVFFLLGGVGLFNGILSNEYIPQKLAQSVIAMGLSPTVFLFAYMLFLLLLGCLVDASGMIALTVPLVFPTAIAMGIDPIALGILIIVNCELGAITPPMGITLYGVSGVTKVPIETILRGVVPFFLVVMAFLVFLVLNPWMATWLPETMYTPVFAGG